MKLTWLVFVSVLLLLGAYGFWQNTSIKNEALASTGPQAYAATSVNGGQAPARKPAKLSKPGIPGLPAYKGTVPRHLLPDSITAYGLTLMGTPYLAAGITCDGFDCSGFIHHIFGRFGVALPHASALLISEGQEITLAEVKKGDLLIFTGPGSSTRTPGHVGVVITKKGELPEFVHSSSAGGVKISKVAGTGYQKRFLQARRVL